MVVRNHKDLVVSIEKMIHRVSTEHIQKEKAEMGFKLYFSAHLQQRVF